MVAFQFPSINLNLAQFKLAETYKNGTYTPWSMLQMTALTVGELFKIKYVPIVQSWTGQICRMNEYGVQSQCQESCAPEPEGGRKGVRDIPSGRLVTVARDTEWYIAVVPGGWCQKELQLLILKACRFGQFRLWKPKTCLDSERQGNIAREFSHPLMGSPRRL